MTALDRVLGKLEGVQKSGSEFAAWCPVHEADGNGHSRSLSVKHDDGKVLLCCHAECSSDAVLGAIGLTFADLFDDEPTRPKARTKATAEKLGPIAAVYPYQDWDGAVKYETTRHDPKDFRQRRRNEKGGYVWSIEGVERVLYGLPDLIDKTDVCLAEGEEDVKALRELGFTATTSCSGAKAWRKGAYAEQFVKAGCLRLNVLPDNDAPGRGYAEDVARSCAAAGIVVRVINLPGLPAGGDVRDWVRAGHTRKELLALVADAPVWAPAADALRPMDAEGDG